MTGVFSLPQASVSFLIIAVGGLAVGAVAVSIITGLRLLLRRSGLEDETMHMLIHLLTPFVLYLTAEELGMSGILAAVAGGVIHAVERDRSYQIRPKTNEVSDNTWSVILYLLNGLVFVMLGLQIPVVFRPILDSTGYDNMEVTIYAVIIFLMLLVLRFLWTLAFSQGGSLFGKNKYKEKFSFKILAMTSLSGVRGAVTLAGAFSIPLVLNDGSPFPERSLILFLATVVILLSLLAASVLLPLLAKKDGKNNVAEHVKKEREGQTRMMQPPSKPFIKACTTTTKPNRRLSLPTMSVGSGNRNTRAEPAKN